MRLWAGNVGDGVEEEVGPEGEGGGRDAFVVAVHPGFVGGGHGEWEDSVRFDTEAAEVGAVSDAVAEKRSDSDRRVQYAGRRWRWW